MIVLGSLSHPGTLWGVVDNANVTTRLSQFLTTRERLAAIERAKAQAALELRIEVKDQTHAQPTSSFSLTGHSRPSQLRRAIYEMIKSRKAMRQWQWVAVQLGRQIRAVQVLMRSSNRRWDRVMRKRAMFR